MSQVYETIELSRLSELAAFANATDLERVVVNTARSNGIQVCIHSGVYPELKCYEVASDACLVRLITTFVLMTTFHHP